MSVPDLDNLDEEFNNFMHQVTQVNNIVHKLASKDKELQELGDLEAQKYLGENKEQKLNINEENVELRIRNNRTVLNKKALLQDDNPQTQSAEAFMEEVSKDADRRYKDKLRRKERMETFKKQATLAFRRGEFEKALSLYNKGIEQIKDSCLLYTNRALTYINLSFYDKAIEDLERALQLNEDSLKARLLLAKAYYLKNDEVNFNGAIREVRNRHDDQEEFIDDFVNKLILEVKKAN